MNFNKQGNIEKEVEASLENDKNQNRPRLTRLISDNKYQDRAYLAYGVTDFHLILPACPPKIWDK